MSVVVQLSGGAIGELAFRSEGGLTHDQECYEKAVTDHEGDAAAQGEAIDACAKAPNPLIPATNELIWGAVGFLVVLVFIFKFGFPAIKKTMAVRAAKIQGDLDSADKARQQADELLEEYKRQLADAKAESGRIIDDARAQADQLRQDLMSKAEADAAASRAKTAEEIDAAKQRAVADLRSEVANLSIGLAEKVVGRSIDRGSQDALIDEFISQVGKK